MRIRTSMRRGPRGIRDGHEQEKVAATAHDEYPSAPRAPSPWRNRDYLLLLSGQSVSALGSYISGLAYPLLALALTHSPAQAGLVSVGSFVSYLAFSLVAGVWVDRLDRRAIMVACAAGQALVAGSIPLAAALGHLSVSHLVVAEGAALPRVLPPAQVPAVVARNEVVQSASALGGPPLGGLIYQALGRTAPMLLDAISYAVSALSLALLRTPLQEERAAAPRHIGREVADGLAWLRGQALVRAIMIYSGALFFVINASRFVLIVLARAGRVGVRRWSLARGRQRGWPARLPRHGARGGAYPIPTGHHRRPLGAGCALSALCRRPDHVGAGRGVGGHVVRVAAL